MRNVRYAYVSPCAVNLKPETTKSSLAEILAAATRKLTAQGIPNAKLEAEVLLAHVLGLTRTALFARFRDLISEEDSAKFHQLLLRRQQYEPLQYITGVQEFWSLEFHATPDVLIPRPETELVVETALWLLSQHATRNTQHEELSSQYAVCSRNKEKQEHRAHLLVAPLIRNPQSAIRILDVGTGSGCIAIALATELPHAEVWATDMSLAALAVAHKNAQRHNVTERSHFLQGDLFTPFQNLGLTFNLIVSNPPYIASNDINTLQAEVKDWEPHQALDGGKDGLDFYRRLLQEGARYLQPCGWLVMEIGHEQGEAVVRLAQQQPELTNSMYLLDYEGRERVVLTQKKPGKPIQK